MEQTLAIIKPEAVAGKFTGDIIRMIERNDFVIDKIRKMVLTKEDVENFYGIHRERPWFGEFCAYVISGPVVVLLLQKENAVQQWRSLIGATDPLQAAEGTVRKLFGTSVGKNAVHGSDSIENAKKEILFFFA